MGASKTSFTLKNTNLIQMLVSMYVKAKNIITVEEDNPSTVIHLDDTTEDPEDIPISEIMHDRSKRAHYFLDPRKIRQKNWGVMIDVTENGPLPNSTGKPCWWCRHSFHSMPIGCPLRYHPPTTSGQSISIKELRGRFEEKLAKANFTIGKNDLFETEGYFCSFCCCKAFILSQRGMVKYKESLALLSLLYQILYGKKPTFPTASTWKVLKEYGGHLTIDEYRASFGQLEYEETVNVVRPYMFCTSQYISEKRIKLFRGVKET